MTSTPALNPQPEAELEIVFEGHIPSKKNSGRMVRRFGKGGVSKKFRLPSAAYCEWHKGEFLSLVSSLPGLEAIARRHESVKDFEPVWYDGEEGDIDLATLIKAMRKEGALYPAPYRLEYDFYPGNLKVFDLSNAEESINDLLVDTRIIHDDSWPYLRQREGTVAGFNPKNEYCVVRLYLLPSDGALGALRALTDKDALKATAKRSKQTQAALRRQLEAQLAIALGGK